MEHPRTTSARDHDDSAIIDAASEAPSAGGRAGGNMAADLATRDELAEIDDPDRHTRVTKSASIDHAAAQRSDRARAPDAGARKDQPDHTVG